MVDNVFLEGDRVVVIAGKYKGCLGVVDTPGTVGVPVMIETRGRPLHITQIPPASLRLIGRPEK